MYEDDYLESAYEDRYSPYGEYEDESDYFEEMGYDEEVDEDYFDPNDYDDEPFDDILERQELEDFEQADEYFGG